MHGAVELLRAGEIVALPTETVYGLAADALNAAAVAKIFQAKERPKFDPLIVHLSHRAMLDRVASIQDPDAELVERLTQAFWPGPLTLLLEKREIIPDLVTAGLETIAVRVSAHPIFAQIVKEFDGPLAAPSANRFGRISPTQAADVLAEIGERIPFIVDGGSTEHGIESTIVRIAAGELEIMRQGPITAEALTKFGKVRHAHDQSKIIAPGQSTSHYAPRTKLVVVDDIRSFAPAPGKRVGALFFRETPVSAASRYKFAATRELSARGDFREAAANLFRFMRELDDAGVDLIVAQLVPEEGIGCAINDRLRRAAAKFP